MIAKICLAVVFLATAYGQNKEYRSFDWKPLIRQEWPRRSTFFDDTTTSSYSAPLLHSAPYPTVNSYFHQDTAAPYPYQDDSPYSSEYEKSQPYVYPDSSYGEYEKDNFNVTIERFGGFGGTGDIRGYGAFDYPKPVNNEVHDEPHDDRRIDEPRENHRVNTEFPDLLRIGRSRTVFHRRNPGYVRPLPPPL